MSRLSALACMLAAAPGPQAQDSISVPWEEFKQLYRESVEREVMARVGEEAKESAPQVFSLDEAIYTVAATEESAQISVRLSGRILSGDPSPIPLFGQEALVAKVETASGGAFLSQVGEAGGLCFLADGLTPFEAALDLVVPIQEDSQSRFVSLSIPAAVRSVVLLALPAAWQLAEEPGLKLQDGSYVVNPGSLMTLRFAEESSLEATASDQEAPAGLDSTHLDAPVTDQETLPVLDSTAFCVAFEENGGVLSVLSMDVPPEVGPKLRLNPVQGAEIWSLKVNENRKKVYVLEDGAWEIPLTKGETSHVELAFIRRGNKLGLQGSMEAILPATGLPSQELRVVLALPERMELLSVDGPVSPAQGESWPKPEAVVGRPHFFSQSFYKGEQMALTLTYKEPVMDLPEESN